MSRAHASLVPAALLVAMSLRQALEFAHAHQPSLAAARARVEVARAAAAIPRGDLGPKLAIGAELLVGTSNNTTASYATIGALDLARIGGTPANATRSWSPEPSTVVGASLHQELYDFGRLEFAGDALDAAARAQAESAKAQQLDLDLYVEEGFYAVLGAKAVLSASDAAVTRAQAHRDLANAKVGAQLMSPIELTRADADLTRFQVQRLQARGALAIAQAVLAAAIGSDGAVDAGDDDVSFADGDLRLDHAPALRAAKESLTAQQATTESIRRMLMPDLAFSAEVTGRAGGATVASGTVAGDGWLPDVPNWDALVVISWPIFDRGVSARVKASQRQEQVRAAEVAVVAQALSAAAAQAKVVRDTAAETLPALQRAVDAATANHDQADARFTAGLGTAVELADAEALLTDAQIQLAIGQFQLARAKARFARAIAE